MAFALLPVIILSIVQMQADFRVQEADRAQALQLAATRASLSAKARLDSTVVLLDALSPETLGAYCGPRLSSLVQRLEGYQALYRMSPTGDIVCGSRPAMATSTPEVVRGRPWFQRLRSGEHAVVMRANGRVADGPSVIVAVRSERPMGRFDGAMTAVIPLEALQPDVTDPDLPAGSQAALTDAQGNVLISTDPAAFDLKGRGLKGWVDRARDTAGGSSLFEGDTAARGHRVFSGAALAGRDVYVVLSAPAPDLWSWAVLNPIGNLLLPLGAWLTAFAAVMLVSERIVVRWLDYLERIAAIYARGRFSVRPIQAAHAPTEIRVLARTLDDLAETITTRDRALLDSLSEKDALMREIHHRVKNNLQIISSLLSMQQRALTDPAAKAAVGDTRQRIAALALIYRTLYQSADLRYADAKVFLGDLVGQLVAGEALRGPMVTSSVDADSLVIDPDKLAPLALWLVEAVSNAQKHAFAGRGGDLKVRFRVQGDTSVLEVQDDGPGVTDAQARGVGRTLMNAFAKQLRGEAELVPGSEGGSIARMTFATPEAVIPDDPADIIRREAGT
ncbi:MAG TPA: sensor histidine kinase [Brevundimonas sp.]|uniref:sensor histidine kinase PhyK n=1 Tax=Brevundimonas sp. TaxID=1871086 RepID=UPI0026213339|nr:sensor histidine kinase [Brevundimonas sp.]HRO32776.1 sensor histidine kinase [Brevundimonas sp.]